MDHVKNYLYNTNVLRLYTRKNDFILFLNVCDIYDVDIKDTQICVKNFKNNLNITVCLFITNFIITGYEIVFNLLLIELVLILMRFSFECGKQHLINYKYVGLTKPYTLISSWNV
jgi:hypothetical protein